MPLVSQAYQAAMRRRIRGAGHMPPYIFGMLRRLGRK